MPPPGGGLRLRCHRCDACRHTLTLLTARLPPSRYPSRRVLLLRFRRRRRTPSPVGSGNTLVGLTPSSLLRLTSFAAHASLRSACLVGLTPSSAPAAHFVRRHASLRSACLVGLTPSSAPAARFARLLTRSSPPIANSQFLIANCLSPLITTKIPPNAFFLHRVRGDFILFSVFSAAITC